MKKPISFSLILLLLLLLLLSITFFHQVMSSPLPIAAPFRPLFQAPYACAQVWAASTYNGHWPDQDSLDMAQRRVSDNANICEGEAILAAADGIVDSVFTSNNGEHRVYIDYGAGYLTHYIHLETLPPLVVGQKVTQGEQIGRCSNSGTQAMHLHFTELKDGDAVRSSFNGELVSTHQGDPSTWGKWGKLDTEEIMSVNCLGESFMSFNYSRSNFNLIYKPSTGDIKIIKMDADGTGTTTTYSNKWSQGWTHHTSFYLPSLSSNAGFVYKSSTGYTTFIKFSNDGTSYSHLATGTWGKGWTDFVTWSQNNRAYVLAYNSLTGAANVEIVRTNGKFTDNIYKSGGWITGRTLLVPYTAGGHQYILLYIGNTGNTMIYEIITTLDSVTFTWKYTGTWDSGMSHLAPVVHYGKNYLITYKPATRDFSVKQMDDAGNGAITKYSTQFGNLYTHFTPFVIGTTGYVFIYNTGSGVAKTLKLKANAIGYDQIWQGFWNTGWN